MLTSVPVKGKMDRPTFWVKGHCDNCLLTIELLVIQEPLEAKPKAECKRCKAVYYITSNRE